MAYAVIANDAKLLAYRAFTFVAPYVEVRLFTNNITPVPATVLADLTEASYPGYAGFTWTLGTPFLVPPDDKAFVPSAVATFGCPTSGGDVNVYGIYVRFYLVTWTLLYSQRFAGAPLVFEEGADPKSFVCQLDFFDPHNP